MKYDFLFEESSLIDETANHYAALRNQGYKREEALEQVKSVFYEEINDEDDRAYVAIALALVLCRKKELTQKAKKDAIHAAEYLQGQAAVDGDTHRSDKYYGLLQFLAEKDVGPEASYKARKPYDPGWSIGDTFIHQLSQMAAERIGLLDWYIVIRKVGEYINTNSHRKQLVYVTVCPPDRVPKDDKELQALGFLRMMDHSYAWDYLGQLDFKNKKDEERWGFQKIGCFPNAGCPDDATDEDPLVSMPIFGGMGENGVPSYEYQICMLIKTRGIHHNSV